MKLQTELYTDQKSLWPAEGRHILAQYDNDSIIVYQAYRPAIARFALKHGHFGGEFSFSRMSWIKPNFLWMMFRSGWGTKEDQEVTLAVRLNRHFFDYLLEQAVPSNYDQDLYDAPQPWKDALAATHVHFQWDPDHDPAGTPVQRRAIQLGLRDEALQQYAREAVLEVGDISEFVAAQRQYLTLKNFECLMTPRERVYVPANVEITTRLKLAHADALQRI